MDYNSSNFKFRERADKFINYLLFLSVTIAFLTLAALVIDILNDGFDWFDFQFFNSFPSRKPEIAGIKAAFYGTNLGDVNYCFTFNSNWSCDCSLLGNVCR